MTSPMRIVRSLSILTLTKTAATILSMLTSIILIRYLGGARNGTFSVVFAYLSFFQVATNSGIETIAIREAAQNESLQNEIAGTAILLKVAFSAISLVASWIVLLFIGYNAEVKSYVLLTSVILFFSVGNVYPGLYQVNYKTASYAVPEVLVGLASTAATFLLIHLKGALVHFLVLRIVTMGAYVVVYAAFAKRSMGLVPVLRLDKSIAARLVRESWPVLLLGFMLSVYARFDQVFLYPAVGSELLGIYASAVKLVEALNMVPGILVAVLQPALCSLYVEDRARFRALYNYGYRISSTFIVAMAVGTTILSARLMAAVFGAEFAAGSSALAILVWSEVAAYLGSVNSAILIAAGLQRLTLVTTIGAVVINLVLNIVLIPPLGIAGAAIATTATVAAMAAQFFMKATREYIFSYVKSLVHPLLAAAVMGALVYVAKGLPLWVVIPGGAAAYAVVLYLTRGISREDVAQFRRILKGRIV